MRLLRMTILVALVSGLLSAGVPGIAAQTPETAFAEQLEAMAVTAGGAYTPVAELVPPTSPSSVRAVEAEGAYAYVLSRGGVLYTYEISGLPTSPPLGSDLLTLNNPVHTLSVGYGGGLLRYGQVLYAWSGAGVTVIDTSTPAAPTLGEPFTERPTDNMIREGNVLVSVGRGHVTVFEVRDPAAPQEVASADLGEENRGWSAAVLGQVLVVGQFASGAGGVTGLAILDFPDPAKLSHQGTFQAELAYHLRGFGDHLVACNSENVTLWDFTVPDDPALRTSAATRARVCARDGENVVTNGDVLRPEGDALIHVGSFDPLGGQVDGFPYESDVEGAHVFLAQSARALVVARPSPLAVATASQPATIDGRVSLGEWDFSQIVSLQHGFVAAQSDATHLYLLINMIEDPTPDGSDGYSISFDVNGDGEVTPGVDVNVYSQPETGNLRRRFYDTEGFLPDEQDYRSSRARGFSCSVDDGTLYLPLRGDLVCNEHVLWELAIDLTEIGAEPGDRIYMGIGVTSGQPEYVDAVPADYLYDFSNLLALDLAIDGVKVPPWDGLPAMGFALDPIEVTQAVQTPDNALPLVADKETAARVYLANNDGSATTMSVFLYGRRGGVDLPGSPLHVLFTAPTTVDRDRLDDTANFRLPSSWTGSGSVEFQARSRRILGAESTTTPMVLDFQTRRVPVVWTVPVNRGSESSPRLLPAADIEDGKSYMETVFPVSQITYVDKPWTALGASMPHGDSLLNELNEYYGSAVLAWIFGLLFTGESPFDLPDQLVGFTPTSDGKADPTWFNNGLGYVAYAGDIMAGDLIAAHEVNHLLDGSSDGTWGRHNGGCGSPGVDPNWPYANDDVNEVGFDTRAPWVNGVVASRRTVITSDYPDFMSYCQHPSLPGTWISPYRWEILFDHFAPAGAAVANLATQQAVAQAAAVEEVMYLSGRLGVGGDGELAPVMVQFGMPTPTPSGTQYTIEVRDGSDLLLESLSFDILFEDVEGDPVDEIYVNFRVPNPTGVAHIALYRGTTLLDEISVSATVPDVTILTPSGGEVWQTTGTIVWEASDPDGDSLTFSLFYSPDTGATWHPVASGLTGTTHEVDADLLPGGTGGKIRIVASDGYNTTTVDSAGTFTVANRAPRPTITAPKEGDRFDAGVPILLKGTAQDAEDGTLPGESLLWSVDGAPVAVGQEAEVVLGDGFHVVELTALDGDGNTGSTTRRIVVGNAGRVFLPLVMRD